MADPNEEVEVALEVRARGTVRARMTRAKFDELFPEGGGTVDIDDVPNLDWDDVVNMMDFEVDDAEIEGG